MSVPKKLLVVEDEAPIRTTLVDFFTAQSFEVIASGDGTEGMRLALSEQPDLVLLDVMLPGMHGFDVCSKLLEHGFKKPIIFLTAKAEEMDKLQGFGLGAEDYITKPFSLLELHARVKVALRHAENALPDEEAYRFGDVEVNFTSFDITVGGQPVKLAAKEVELLRFLIRHRGQVVQRDTLLQKVWNYSPAVTTRTVDTHVLNLRRKLGDNQPHRYIHTVRGVGYKFTGDD